MLRLLFGLGVIVVVVVGDVLVYDKSETLVDEFNDLPSRFGPIFPLDGKLKGKGGACATHSA